MVHEANESNKKHHQDLRLIKRNIFKKTKLQSANEN